MGTFLFFSKYRLHDKMQVHVEETNATRYPEDPANKSRYYGRYGNRSLLLERIDKNHFNFILQSSDPSVATVSFKNVDLRLFIPIQPQWVKGDKNLSSVTLSERQFSHQQTAFNRESKYLAVQGGDGVEENALESAELVKNSLNAGLFEVQLFTKEKGEKALYYQGWFKLPLGHYKEIFEAENHISYWSTWHRLEHFIDPQGTAVELDKLRSVMNEREVAFKYDPLEPIAVQGEQLQKARILNASGLRCWGDFCNNKQLTFATFNPPGRYNVLSIHGNEFARIEKIDKVLYRQISSPAQNEPLEEIELVFKHAKDGSPQRIIISGVAFSQLPQLSMRHYSKGLYMPMGISTPPLHQSYEELVENPPEKSPYFCVMLEKDNQFVNHHRAAIDGPIAHRDLYDPNLLHIYLMSYERQTLVAHFVLDLSN
jgi:hypothetical protein